MSEFKFFKRDEFACKCGCGTNRISDEIIMVCDSLRGECGFPFVISSGYRCEDHPIEAVKSQPGAHQGGMAADIACSGDRAQTLIRHALNYGITRIGINQKGSHSSRFVHIDVDNSRVSPAIWTY
tara:strand:+ start:274 stop:648 length:375 start_codon:yes stop_codon:yes gene_type:complete